MITTRKTILALGLCLAFFYSCSNDDAFLEATEGATITKRTQASITDSTAPTQTAHPEISDDIKSNTSAEQAGKTEEWFNGGGDNPVGEDPEFVVPTMDLIVEFRDGITATEKMDARTRYTAYLGLLSYVTCGGSQTNKEIWTLDQAIYEDDTIPSPCTSCPQGPNFGDPLVTTKSDSTEEDPDFNRVKVSTTSSPCLE
ncbi:hypothetical protein N7U66_09275 [Lacinutrix neustonica]|uniref:Lipoprotein n=1 Tax=Lacinutrix neustonica TaxID=2980107 RepID=A0A9E8MZ95_9FLAO|nr:hypothetical protein [Lacinutrix neustonica]WAC03624.1 hypothetical protein N7U66_09275 [Lacinutrix neustonica]